MLKEEEIYTVKERISALQQNGKLKPSRLLLGILERTNTTRNSNDKGTYRHLSRTKRKLARRKSLNSIRRKKRRTKRSTQKVTQ